MRKSKSYGTLMIDFNANRIVDMIATRDYEPVSEWLKSYPNLQVISRDGSITYKNAIESSHPEAIQVSDRFHLLKNLTSYAMEYLKKKLKTQTAIPSGEQTPSCKSSAAISKGTKPPCTKVQGID
jgi:transposase